MITERVIVDFGHKVLPEEKKVIKTKHNDNDSME